MIRLTGAFGRPLALLILLFAGLWILGLIAAPQAIMTEQSLWRIHSHVVIPHARPGVAVGCIMTRGTAAPWFTQLNYNRCFEATNWNGGAAYALGLLVVCTLFIFGMMRLLKVSLKDIAT